MTINLLSIYQLLCSRDTGVYPCACVRIHIKELISYRGGGLICNIADMVYKFKVLLGERGIIGETFCILYDKLKGMHELYSLI